MRECVSTGECHPYPWLLQSNGSQGLQSPHVHGACSAVDSLQQVLHLLLMTRARVQCATTSRGTATVSLHKARLECLSHHCCPWVPLHLSGTNSAMQCSLSLLGVAKRSVEEGKAQHSKLRPCKWRGLWLRHEAAAMMRRM